MRIVKSSFSEEFSNMKTIFFTEVNNFKKGLFETLNSQGKTILIRIFLVNINKIQIIYTKLYSSYVNE